MKIIYSLILIFSFFVLLNGCIEVRTLVSVNPDGSGQFEETVLLNKEITDLLAQFSSDSAGNNSFNLFNEEEMIHKAKNYGEDVKYISGEKLSEKNKEGYKVIYSFKDLNNLKINENPGSRIPDESGEMEEIPENIVFKFTKGNPSEIQIFMPDNFSKDNDEKMDTTSSMDSLENAGDELEKMKYFLKDMLISVDLKINGIIKETNASYVEDSKITLLKIDFNEVLNDSLSLQKIENIQPENIEMLKKIIKNVPGIKVELQNPVNIKFD